QGVETQRQLALLRAEGCDEIQGYLVSRAVAAADVPAHFGGEPHVEKTSGRAGRPARPAGERGPSWRWRTAAYAAGGALALLTVLSSTWPRGAGGALPAGGAPEDRRPQLQITTTSVEASDSAPRVAGPDPPPTLAPAPSLVPPSVAP